jgi:hypothetical protein
VEQVAQVAAVELEQRTAAMQAMVAGTYQAVQAVVA